MPHLTFPSQYIPDATFTIQALNRFNRHQLELKLSAIRYQNRLLLDQLRDVILDHDGLRKLAKPLTTEQLTEWRKDNSQDPSPIPLDDREKDKLAQLEEQTHQANQLLRMTVARERLVSVKLPDEYQNADPWTGSTEDETLNAKLELFAQEIEDKTEEGWLLPDNLKKKLG